MKITLKHFAVMLFAFVLMSINLSAQTVWLKDVCPNQTQLNRFIDYLKKDLKTTSYKNSIKYVTNNSQIKAEPGDLVIELSGFGSSDLVTSMIVMCEISSTLGWNYRSNYGWSSYSNDGSHPNIFDHFFASKEAIIKFIDDNY